MKQLCTLIAIGPHVTLTPNREQYEGHYCYIITSDEQFAPFFRAAKFKMLTGPRTGETRNCSLIKFEPISDEEAVEAGDLCLCTGHKEPHEPGCFGCHNEEDGPFCGKCGLPCEIVTVNYDEPDEFWGMPCRRPYTEQQSDCCNSDDNFSDASLTQPLP